MPPFYFLFYVSASVCSGDVPIVAVSGMRTWSVPFS